MSVAITCVHVHVIYIYIYIPPGSRADGMADHREFFFPSPLSLPRGGKSPAPSLLLLLLLPLLLSSSPPPRFLSSRFIFRALIASSLCLPFSYWRHVILLLPLPLPPPGSAASAIDDFFKQQRILIAVLSPQILAIITGGQWGRSDTSLRPGSVRIKFSVRNSLKIIFPEI